MPFSRLLLQIFEFLFDAVDNAFEKLWNFMFKKEFFTQINYLRISTDPISPLCFYSTSCIIICKKMCVYSQPIESKYIDFVPIAKQWFFAFNFYRYMYGDVFCLNAINEHSYVALFPLFHIISDSKHCVYNPHFVTADYWEGCGG